MLFRSRFAPNSPMLFKFSRRKRRSVAAALHDHRWVADLRYAPRPAILTDFLRLWRLIDDAQVMLTEHETDQITWTATGDGCYSAKAVYRLQFEGQIRSDMTEKIWSTWAPPKTKFFAWLLLQNRLWTADRLMRRRWPNCYFCPFCIRNLETAWHLFFDCPFARMFWLSIATWRRCSSLSPHGWRGCTSIAQVWDNTVAATPEAHHEGIQSLLMLGCWNLWKERNCRVFKEKPSSLRWLLNQTQEDAKAWALAGAKKMRRMIWEPP